MLVYSFLKHQSIVVKGKFIGGKVHSDLETLLLLVEVWKIKEIYML
jgi:hypothetical protein